MCYLSFFSIPMTENRSKLNQYKGFIKNTEYEKNLAVVKGNKEGHKLPLAVVFDVTLKWFPLFLLPRDFGTGYLPALSRYRRRRSFQIQTQDFITENAFSAAAVSFCFCDTFSYLAVCYILFMLFSDVKHFGGLLVALKGHIDKC